jgi:hypothetical protein
VVMDWVGGLSDSETRGTERTPIPARSILKKYDRIRSFLIRDELPRHWIHSPRGTKVRGGEGYDPSAVFSDDSKWEAAS